MQLRSLGFRDWGPLPEEQVSRSDPMDLHSSRTGVGSDYMEVSRSGTIECPPHACLHVWVRLKVTWIPSGNRPEASGLESGHSATAMPMERAVSPPHEIPTLCEGVSVRRPACPQGSSGMALPAAGQLASMQAAPLQRPSLHGSAAALGMQTAGGASAGQEADLDPLDPRFLARIHDPHQQ